MYECDEIVFVKDLYPHFFVNDTYANEKNVLLLSQKLPVPRNGHESPLYVITKYDDKSLNEFLDEMQLSYCDLNFISEIQ